MLDLNLAGYDYPYCMAVFLKDSICILMF